MCENSKPHEWLNWQKCWAEPLTREDGALVSLAYRPDRNDYIQLRLHSQANYECYVFWWFFVCRDCRNRRIDLFNFYDYEISAGYSFLPRDGKSRSSRPIISRPRGNEPPEINIAFKVGDRWDPPPDPDDSSDEDNPWIGHLE